MEQPKVCNTCKNLQFPKLICPAFPGGIPMPFLSGDQEHINPIPGQTGETVWEPKTPKKKA